MFNTDEVGDDERDAAVEENEERDAEEGDAQQVCNGLQGGSTCRERQIPQQAVARRRHCRKLRAASLFGRSFWRVRGDKERSIGVRPGDMIRCVAYVVYFAHLIDKARHS